MRGWWEGREVMSHENNAFIDRERTAP